MRFFNVKILYLALSNKLLNLLNGGKREFFSISLHICLQNSRTYLELVMSYCSCLRLLIVPSGNCCRPDPGNISL